MEPTDNKQLRGRQVLLFLAVLALGLSAALPSGAAGADVGALADFIDDEMPASAVPGLAYAVVDEGELTSVGARGVVKIGDDKESRRTHLS
jgi:CubicO group peptidase (beta-lactamase class C family)